MSWQPNFAVAVFVDLLELQCIRAFTFNNFGLRKPTAAEGVSRERSLARHCSGVSPRARLYDRQRAQPDEQRQD